MRWITGILFIILAQATLSAQDNTFNILFKQDFENSTPGLYNHNEWRRDWNSPPYSNGLEKTYILKTGDGNRVMQWNYPKGSVGPTDGGAQWEAPFTGQDEVYLSYNIKFKPGFDWVEGGKLPGLGGGPAYGSGTPMEWDEGFSARLMWRFGENDGKVMFYAYYQNKTGIYGAGHPWSDNVFVTTPERWYNMTVRLVLNSIDQNKLTTDPQHAGNTDGLMEGFIDGKLVCSVTGICFRNLPSIKIDDMHITSFFGGNGSNYAAARDEWNLLDDVYLFTYASGVNVPRGHTPSPAGRVLQLPNLKTASTVNTADITAPTVPTGLKKTAKTTSSVSLGWNASTDNTKVTGYRVFVDGVAKGTTGSTSYTVSGLAPGTSYAFSVSAFDAASNESARSQVVNIVTDSVVVTDTLAPTVPDGLTITGTTENSADLSWSPSTDNTAVSGYIVFVDGIVRGISTLTSYAVTDLQPNTTYSLTVSAYDEASNKSAESLPITVTTEDSVAVEESTNDSQDDEEPPELSIIEVHNETQSRTKSISEISSYGNAELRNFGVMVSKNENPIIGGYVFNAEVGTYYVKNDNRVAKNLQVLYNFSEGLGNRVKDISGSDHPTDLTISNPSEVAWLPGQGLKVNGNTIISADQKSTDLLESLRSTGEITMEAWIKPATTEQNGPARIVTLSYDNYNRAAMLGQTGNDQNYDFNVRLNTSTTTPNGIPESSTADKYQIAALQHVIYTRDISGVEKIYVNGVERFSGNRAGDFSNWEDNYYLALANELTGNRPWKGTYFLVAIYNRALTDSEIIQNYRAGFGRVQFNSVLENLEPETHYFLTAFAESDQGTHFGEIVEFVTGNNPVELEDSIQMNVYPNPSDGIFRVSFQYSKVEFATITVHDLSGKIIHSEKIPVNNFGLMQEQQFNMGSKMKNGIYFVTLILGETTTTKKLIIQH